MRGAFAQVFPHTRRTRLLAGILAALGLCWPAASPHAQDWTGAAHDLASQLRRQVPPPARLTWIVQNRSTLSEDNIASIRRAISSQLRSAGYHASRPQSSVVQVRIGVSENFEDYLWVAQVVRGETTSVIMLAIPRAPAAPPRETSNLVISKKLLIARDEPILDLTMIPASGQSSPRLLVLGPSSMAVYETSGATWQASQSTPIAALHIWPRDVRGRLTARPDGTFEASLPGERCAGSINLLASVECRASDEPWPVADTADGAATAHFAADRNYFIGPVLAPNNQALTFPDFYAAVPLENRKESPWLVAATDGQARLLDASRDRAEFHGWGSQLAATKSSCGRGALILVTRPSDFVTPDAVQLLDIRGRAAETVNAPAEFSGPITLLRNSSEEGSAFAVVHALPSGLYEAYRLSITCSD